MAEICDRCSEREPSSDLHPDALKRLSEILGTHMSDVFAKHRELESKTGQKNSIGRQNLVEALAHVAVVFQRASELNRDEQLAQVAFLEDHLRRVMMEAFELGTYQAIGAIRDNGAGRSLERRYYGRAAPLIRIGRLPGHIEPKQVESKLAVISDEVVSARRAKLADASWDVWLGASDELRTVAGQVEELHREMRAAVDAATSTWRWVMGICLALVLFAVSHIFL